MLVTHKLLGHGFNDDDDYGISWIRFKHDTIMIAANDHLFANGIWAIWMQSYIG